ncbi:MAG: trypsin-like serine protease [Nannocystaceae bacterium]
MIVLTAITSLLLAMADPAAVDPIYGGEPATEAGLESAVFLRAHHRNCSAVMVSETVGLTAAHCLAEMKFGQQVTATFGPSTIGGQPFQVSRWGVHPGYCPGCDEDPLDLGFIETTLPMEGVVDPAVPIVTQSDWDALMRPGQVLTAVGYGLDGTDAAARERRRIEVVIDEVAKNGRELITIPRGGGTCDGDSGGPLFGRLDDGSLRVVGIHSRSVGGCPSDWSVAAVPYRELCWLRDETELDLLAPGDDDCRMLDTMREGCRVAPRPVGWAHCLGLLMLVLGSRSRRSPSACGSDCSS